MTSPQQSWRRTRLPMTVLRGLLLGLYSVLIAAFLFSWIIDDDAIALAIATLIGVAGQVLFIATAGTRDLCQPIQKRRLVLPVIIASFMLALLFLGASLAVAELVQPILQKHAFMDEIMAVAFYLAIPGSWLFWGVVLFLVALQWERFRVFTRFALLLFSGSLAELFATVPSHIIVSKRPGCMVGLATMLGIIAGISVMIWSFGPAIAILFLRPRYLREKALPVLFCAVCGLDLRGSIAAGRKTCPDCKTAIPKSASY